MRTPLAIFVSDIHFREDKPLCRKDNFLETQIRKMNWLSNLQKEYNTPIYNAGDLLHKWKVTPYLISLLIDILPDEFYSVYGNHSLKNHKLSLQDQSGEYTLIKTGKIKLLKDGHWGGDLDKSEGITIGGKKVLVVHHMVWKGNKPYPTCSDPSATGFLNRYKKFDCIVTGDNHIPFTQESSGRLLVNPGSFSRQRTSETHKPRVYLYYSDNTVEPIYIPIEDDVISDSHIQINKSKEARLDAFIEKLDMNGDLDLDFEKALNDLLKSDSIDRDVKEVILEEL
jgi:predicted phosphodiesterase